MTTAPAPEPLTTAEFADAVGTSIRRIDHWVRGQVLVAWRDARGTGSRRLFSCDEVPVARAVLALMDSGSSRTVAAQAAAQLRGLPLSFWTHRVVVNRDGWVGQEGDGHGWVIDLRLCADPEWEDTPAPGALACVG